MMKRILDWLRKSNNSESYSPEMMSGLLQMLANTENEEVACDDVFKVLAEFAEMHQNGENVAEMMPLVKKHLDMCPDCREEFEALMLALEAEHQT